ncbi:MAG: aminoglycoside phosphotransferase family protein [Ruminococcaceae bacterium]|nr:aminoglycoside phosphotransferase family protein [Oscillospiraceae bacterium]
MSITSNTNLIEIIKAFPEFGKYIGYRPITDGHINDTYVIKYETENGECLQYLLQRINVNVFKKPVELMENVCGVTSFLREKIEKEGGDPTRETLTVYPAKDGKNYVMADDGGCWRMYNYVDDTYSINELTSPDDFRSAALSFGNFQNQLADYPIETLHETIPNFHNTPSRFKDFLEALDKNASGRKDAAKPEIDFVLEREKDCSVITDLLNCGDLPLKVTHNDTKLNNVLFDKKTNKGICVVDLDTVMPGSSLYDFGDSIRFGANTAAEDETDLSKVTLSLEYFKAYVEGYLETAGPSLTENEIKYLPFAAKLLTFECGIRFLGDFINGDVYFKVDYPEHNLIRARTQFKLVEDIEAKYNEMVNIVDEAKAKILG